MLRWVYSYLRIEQRRKSEQQSQDEQIKNFQERRKGEHKIRRNEEMKKADEMRIVRKLTRQQQKEQFRGIREQIKIYQKDIFEIDKREAERIKEIESIDRRDILSLSLALHKIRNDKAQGGDFATIVYLFIFITFTLFDAAAITIKFLMKAGPYDSIVDREEHRFETDNRIFKERYSHYATAIMESELALLTNKKKIGNKRKELGVYSKEVQDFLRHINEQIKDFNELINGELKGRENGLDKLTKDFYEYIDSSMDDFFVSLKDGSQSNPFARGNGEGR